jgi:hypothetical protein
MKSLCDKAMQGVRVIPEKVGSSQSQEEVDLSTWRYAKVLVRED